MKQNAAGIMLLIALIAAAGSVCSAEAPEPAPSVPDSSAAADTAGTSLRLPVPTRWSAIYGNRLFLSKESGHFPWNDEEAMSHFNDRIAFLLEIPEDRPARLFLKGSTGYRKEESDIYNSRFVLEQGHIGYMRPAVHLDARAFLRERVYWSYNRLLQFVSNDAQMLSGRGEGLSVAAGGAYRYGLRYTWSTLRGDWIYDDYGGLPVFRGGGDVYQLLNGYLGFLRGWRLGFLISDVRSTDYGDVAAIGADLGIRLGSVDIVGELVRTESGDLSDLDEGPLLGVDASNMSLDSFSSIFSDDAAFSAEVHGLTLRSQSAGIFTLLPGYRFAGCQFLNPQGEIQRGVEETYVETWWKHPVYELEAAVQAAGLRDVCAGTKRMGLQERILMSFRGGFMLRQVLFLREGSRASAVLSLTESGSKARLTTTARLDDMGDTNELSFLAEGWLNIWKSWTLQSTLYLHKSESGYYSAGLAFRPGRRFLIQLLFGSFTPAEQDIVLNRAYDFDAPAGERHISIFTRIWLGDL
jgi:hypothetical protein